MDERAFRLDGRAGMVVGAGSGIGRAIALAFGAVGATVGCVDRSAETAQATTREIVAAGGKAEAIACDVTSETEARRRRCPVRRRVRAAAHPRQWRGRRRSHRHHPGADACLVGESSRRQPDRALSDEPGCPAAHDCAGGGSIIHIASQMGRVGAAGRPAYCATKGALIQLAKVMAADHAAQNIRVNTLSPGAVETRRMVLRHGDMETAPAGLGPAASPEAAGPARRDRRRRRLSRQRRLELHDRSRPARRRRLYGRLIQGSCIARCC